MTITLSPETEKALREAAAQQGTTPDELAQKILRARFVASQEEPETPEQRRGRIQSLKGSMAHLGPSRLLEDRAEDRVREERRWQK
jgi:hypothetical protein